MNSFKDALVEKIADLEGEKQAFVEQIDAKIAVLTEILEDEAGESSGPPKSQATSKRRGRPRGSKNKKKQDSGKSKVPEPNPEADALYLEAMEIGGDAVKTDPELAERLKKRFRPLPRVRSGYGSVRVGSEKSAPERQSNSTISMPDDLEPGEE